MRFREEQRFSLRLITIIAIVPAVIIAVLLFLTPIGRTDWRWALFVALALVVVLTVILNACSMTTEVDGTEVRVNYFPFILRSIPLSSITSVKPTEMGSRSEYRGWGIRRTPHGTTYGLAGKQAIRLGLDDGRYAIIGSTRPVELLAAIGR